ncbi:hypothetical protein J7E97_01635 [Streptomyces sp. ISL-66]|uniref:hypothetical protein n=1 Tax=Streptomyces sp. ISL-66 TaxID=2819186 RepID=UPI001BE82425|nr:hypothetical protein [Streptomyces sp. ISL-66]MBT2466598.1 hypothetical protein [Streptomyces sp. ISL-66]
MPFEDELGEALRRVGDGFTADGRDLVGAGERRGRRLVARRRAAVVGGSALALAVIGTAGAYTGGLFGSDGSGGPSNVATAPTPNSPTASAPSAPGNPKSGEGRDEAAKNRVGSGAVTADQLVGVLKQLLPGGTVTETTARGTAELTGPMVSGVFDDGKGKSFIGVGLSRVDPNGETAAQMVQCPSRTFLDYDSCTSEKLSDGSTLKLFQGYEYPDRREDTKNWRATMVTPQGYLVDAQEFNAPAEKGKPTTRSTPPLTLAQLKTFTTSPLWLPALTDLPAAPAEPVTPRTPGPKAADAMEQLLSGYGIPVVSKEDFDAELGYLVLDDGKGQSLASLQIQPDSKNRPGMWNELFVGAQTLPDGTKIVTHQRRGESAGADWWSVEVLRKNGTRVIVSAYNTKTLKGAPTRPDPALTMERLKEIATSPKWTEFGY